MAEIRVHVQGVDALVRTFDRTIEKVERALDLGCDLAADHLKESIEDKFGVYQPGWERLKYETIAKKRKKGNIANATKPLIDYSDMMFSFYTETSNRTRKHTVTVKSDDPKILYHVYGVPTRNVPKRDPVRPTVKEEAKRCLEIIAETIKEMIG